MSRLSVNGFVNCDQNGLAQMRSIIFVNQKDSFKGDVTDGKLSGVFTHKADSVKSPCKTSVYVSKPYYETPFDRFCKKWFWITSVLIVILGVVFFYKMRVKYLKNLLKT